jgi:hypothetical protein
MDCLTDSILVEFENNNTTRHNSARPPKEAFFYFPKDKDIIDNDPNDPKLSIRKIFEGGTEYTLFEKEELSIFKKELKVYCPEVLPYVDESTCLRFLQATSYNHLKALKNLIENYEWKQKYFPLSLNIKHKEILNTGFVYVHGRDNRFRPIIVVDPSVFLKYMNRFDMDEMINSLIFLLEYVLQNLLIPGQVENWIIICDVSNINVTSIPKEFKMIMNILSRNYKCRLYSMYIMNLSFVFSLLWKAFKSMINPITEKKIIIVQEVDSNCEIFKSINKTQIEKKFGGNAENVFSHFFPPIFPSNNYFLLEENPEDILITEQRYNDLLRNNTKIKVSPYLSANRESYFTFHANDISFKKSEISIYEEAKSQDQPNHLEESKYEECVETYNTKNKDEPIKLEKNEEISLDLYKETIKNSYESNENNVVKEKTSEMDSTITNITCNSK